MGSYGAFKAGQVDDLRKLLQVKEQALEQYRAEADVLSGRACAEEQADGAGPCGACRDCLHARIHLLEAALVSVHKTLSSRSVLPTHELAELEQFTYLVVTGGAVPAREDYETAREWTKR